MCRQQSEEYDGVLSTLRLCPPSREEHYGPLRCRRGSSGRQASDEPFEVGEFPLEHTVPGFESVKLVYNFSPETFAVFQRVFKHLLQARRIDCLLHSTRPLQFPAVTQQGLETTRKSQLNGDSRMPDARGCNHGEGIYSVDSSKAFDLASLRAIGGHRAEMQAISDP